MWNNVHSILHFMNTVIHNILYTYIHIAYLTGFYFKETSRPSHIYYTEYETVYGTIHCMLFSALYCTLYFTRHSKQTQKWRADLALFLRNTFLSAYNEICLDRPYCVKEHVTHLKPMYTPNPW